MCFSCVQMWEQVGVILEGTKMHYRELERIFKKWKITRPTKQLQENTKPKITKFSWCKDAMAWMVCEKKSEGPDLPQNDYTLTWTMISFLTIFSLDNILTLDNKLHNWMALTFQW